MNDGETISDFQRSVSVFSLLKCTSELWQFFFFKRAKTIVVATKGTIIVLHINIQHEESRREKNVYTAYIYKNRFDIKQCIYRLQFTTVKIFAPITPTLLLHCKNVCLNFIAALHF